MALGGPAENFAPWVLHAHDGFPLGSRRARAVGLLLAGRPLPFGGIGIDAARHQ